MTKRSPERAQFLTDTLVTAIEGGINYWASVSDYHWHYPNIHEDGVANAYATILDREDEDAEPVRVDLDTIARGWGLYKRLYKGESISGREYGKQALLANRTNGDDGDFDADVADNVLQLGLLGEIVYG